ncbi:MAG TPA: LON peptidase substrate-binding domain-containing protein [Candidatus Acidoferrales bacterium]|nr:LON peptidase substrate-binding domain-containing protein [Candidatus Acidoferrales bacterium]
MDSSLGLFVLNTVLVPGAVLRLHVFEDRYKALMTHCLERQLPFGVLLDRNGLEVGDGLDPVEIGTTALIRQVTKLGAGRLYVIAVGERRFKVEKLIGMSPFWHASVSYIDEPGDGRDAQVLRDLALERFRDYLQALLTGCGRELDALELPAPPAASSWVIADALQIEPAAKQRLLEARSASDRLRAEIALLEVETRRLRQSRERKEQQSQSAEAASFVARFSRNY